VLLRAIRPAAIALFAQRVPPVVKQKIAPAFLAAPQANPFTVARHTGRVLELANGGHLIIGFDVVRVSVCRLFPSRHNRNCVSGICPENGRRKNGHFRQGIPGGVLILSTGMGAPEWAASVCGYVDFRTGLLAWYRRVFLTQGREGSEVWA
jgi:hypothetical protein